MVENLNLQRAALRRIEELQKKGARVELVEGKRVSAIEEGEGGWPVVKLEGDEARSLRTRLLVRSLLFSLISLNTDFSSIDRS